MLQQMEYSVTQGRLGNVLEEIRTTKKEFPEIISDCSLIF